MSSAARLFGFFAALVVAVLMGDCTSLAQTEGGYPNRSVKMVVPFAAGGPTDVMAPLIAQRLSEDLGKPFYVENQPRVGGNIGMADAAKAAPDGCTILVASSSYVVNPSLYARIPYDPYKDFIPITIAGDSPNVLVVNPSLPVNNVSQLVDLIKANPNQYNFASAGTSTPPHLSGELFKLMFGLDVVHVPFNGAGPAIQSTVARHTPIAFPALPPAAPFVKGGQLRALAVTGKTRSAALPDVPTMAEAGLKGEETDTLQGVLPPAGTPKEITDLLHRAIVKIAHEPDVREKFAALGFEPVANTPDEFASQIRTEIGKWGKVIKDANIKAD